MPVAIAVWRKTRFSQTMGEAEPLPGILTFHFTLFVSLQVSGGFPCGATPLANGPRHCGQFWSVEVEAARATQAPSDIIASAARYARIRKRQGWVFTVQGYADKAMAIRGRTFSARQRMYRMYQLVSFLCYLYLIRRSGRSRLESNVQNSTHLELCAGFLINRCETRSYRCRLTGTRYSFVWPGLETRCLC